MIKDPSTIPNDEQFWRDLVIDRVTVILSRFDTDPETTDRARARASAIEEIGRLIDRIDPALWGAVMHLIETVQEVNFDSCQACYQAGRKDATRSIMRSLIQ